MNFYFTDTINQVCYLKHLQLIQISFKCIRVHYVSKLAACSDRGVSANTVERMCDRSIRFIFRLIFHVRVVSFKWDNAASAEIRCVVSEDGVLMPKVIFFNCCREEIPYLALVRIKIPYVVYVYLEKALTKEQCHMSYRSGK